MNKPKYAIVYVNFIWHPSNGFVATGQTVIYSNDIEELKNQVSIASRSDIFTIIDLETGKEVHEYRREYF